MKKAIVIGAICAIFLVVFLFEYNTGAHAEDPRGELYAGSATCVKCHGGISNSYVHTAHYLASAPATENNVQGNFTPGLNEFNISATQRVVMEKNNKGMFQSFYVGNKMQGKHHFDIVFGGIKGQTYLYWDANELKQLPISFYTKEHQWSTSPGYGFTFVDYRAIGTRCMECHASYINELTVGNGRLGGNEQFDKASLVYRIDCERCHGPGAQHVNFHTTNPGSKTARYIKNYSSLSRGQKIDACAVCHSGLHKTLLRSTFGFMPGDTLAKFKLPEYQQAVDTAHIDVHGKQVQLLESSKCFISSKMDCTTCHNVHQNSRGDNVLYAQKCLTCHNSTGHTYCGMAKKLGAAALQANCINCHMPQLTTKVISVQASGKTPPAKFVVYTHHIAIYPDQSKKILAYLTKR